ncbi:MAG: YihY/virulence factor BrkB family protein [Phycisphaerales bacterium]|nr:YihY/virulence factor BrkB family protein [Phycisphaerales bacterium]
MAGGRINQLREFLRKIERIPQAELTRGQRFVRFMWQLWVTAYRQLRRDRAGSNAAALTFRTLFSMLPMLVLAASLTKAMISEKTFVDSVDDLTKWFHLEDISIGVPSGSGTEAVDLVQWVHQLAEQAMAMDLTGLTWIGLAVVLYSAFRLVEEVDATFNIISRSTPSGWIKRRIWIYIGVILVAPLLTVIAVWLLDRMIEEAAAMIEFWPWVAPLLQSVTSIIMLWWLLQLCYRCIPAREVRPRPAMLGAASATMLLLAGQWMLTLYIDGAVRSSPLGGSLGFVPVFMFWMYLMWLSVLYGLEITMVSQRLSDLRQRDRLRGDSASPA